jgi:hypothetical protein
MNSAVMGITVPDRQIDYIRLKSFLTTAGVPALTRSGNWTMLDTIMTIGARLTLVSFFVLLLALSGVGA